MIMGRYEFNTPYSRACGVAALHIVIKSIPSDNVHFPPNFSAKRPPMNFQLTVSNRWFKNSTWSNQQDSL